MTTTIQPDPSAIGGVPTAPLAFLPKPLRLFATRAKRLAFLAQHSANLGPWLTFLGQLVELQARLAEELPRPWPPCPPNAFIWPVKTACRRLTGSGWRPTPNCTPCWMQC